jgi:hypothetical protein
LNGYTKLFGSIVGSTIWREDDKTRILWITMMALSNKHGIVEASIPGLADFARITLAECEAGLAKLSAPDTYSRTKEHDGRRIEAIDGGWQLLNHGKYRDKMGIDERRAYQAQWQKAKRTKVRKVLVSDDTVTTNVDTRRQMLTRTTQSEADSDTDTKAVDVQPPLKISWEAALKWVKDAQKNGADFTEAECKTAWLAQCSSGWKWGNGVTKDYRTSLELQINKDREYRASKPKPTPEAEDDWRKSL